MTRRTSELYYNRDLVLIWGQSNAGAYGDLIAEWPQRERCDPNWPLACPWSAGGAWQESYKWDRDKGMLAFSLGAQMRYAGLRPAIAAYFIGGTTAAQLQTYLLTYIDSFYGARFAEMISPRSVSLVWSQGESDWYAGTYATWAANTADGIALFRSTLGIPDLHVTIVQLARSYSPGDSTVNLAETRAVQSGLAAADAHASIVGGDLDVVTVNSNIHLGRVGLDMQSKLITADIRTRVTP